MVVSTVRSAVRGTSVWYGRVASKFTVSQSVVQNGLELLKSHRAFQSWPKPTLKLQALLDVAALDLVLVILHEDGPVLAHLPSVRLCVGGHLGV